MDNDDSGDNISDRLRRAAVADPALLDRVVRAALGRSDDGHPAAPTPFLGRRLVRPAAQAVTALVVAAVAAWWLATGNGPAPAGVYRVEALAATDAPEATGGPVGPVPAGVYRVEASLTPASPRVISVSANDGTTWILSTGADEDWPPPGTGIVTGKGGTP